MWKISTISEKKSFQIKKWSLLSPCYEFEPANCVDSSHHKSPDLLIPLLPQRILVLKFLNFIWEFDYRQSIALIDISSASFSFGFTKKIVTITIFGSFTSHLVPFMIPKSHHNTEFDSEILSQLLFREDQSASL